MNLWHSNLKIFVHKSVYLSYFNTYLHNINNTLTYLTKYYIWERNVILLTLKTCHSSFVKNKKEWMKYQGTILNILQSVVVCR